MKNFAVEVCFSELDFNSQCISVAFKLKSLDEYLLLRNNSIVKEQYLYAQKVLSTPVMFAGSQFNDTFLQKVFEIAKAHIQASCAYNINADKCDIRLIFMQRQISSAKASRFM
jgi:hypothetical protein